MCQLDSTSVILHQMYAPVTSKGDINKSLLFCSHSFGERCTTRCFLLSSYANPMRISLDTENLTSLVNCRSVQLAG